MNENLEGPMLGFLSTFSPPAARTEIGTGPGASVKECGLQEASNTLKPKDNSGFHAAFEKGDKENPDVNGGPRRSPVDETLPEGESVSGEPDELDSEMAEPLGTRPVGEEEEALEAFQEGQLESGRTDEPDDPTAYAPVGSKRPEPSVPPILAGGGPDNGASSVDDETGSDGYLSQDMKVASLAHLNSSGTAGPELVASQGAYQSRFAGPSVDRLRVQSALGAGSDIGQHGALSRQVENALIQEILPPGDHATQSETPDPMHHGQIVGAAFGGSGGITTSVAIGETAPSSADRYNAVSDASGRAAMVPSDIMRSSDPLPPEPMLAGLAAKLDTGEESGRSGIMLTEPAISGDVRPSPATPAELRVLPVTGASTPQMARHVAIQLSEAAGKAAERSIDLTLNPSELGRVRITLIPGDGGLVVSVNAERPETLDLMRRHVDLLDHEFRNLGYGATDFTFSKEQSGSEQSERHRSDDTSAPDDASTPDAAHNLSRITSVVVTDRLDIRL